MESSARIRTRAIILHEGKLLVVKHAPQSDYYALPGGKLEGDEGIELCLKRELKEELGVDAHVGPLRYVNQFTDADNIPNIDFIFEIDNAHDFVDINQNERTHAFELSEVRWLSPSDEVRLLPEQLANDFMQTQLLGDTVRFIGTDLQ